MPAPLLAGVGRCDITPAPGTPQGGWGAQTHVRGIGSDLPFYSTALVLEQEGQQVAIVDVDSIGFNTEWTGKIIAAIESLSGLPADRIRFSCTHTHSGPNTFRLATIAEGLDMAVHYLESLPERIASSVWQAQRNLQPVHAAVGKGRCEMNVNRRVRLDDGMIVVGRNPRGPVDHTVRVLRFDDLDSRPVASIVHYACHPTTIAWQTEYFTPDYPGALKPVVERNLGGTCLFLQGATGDLTGRQGFTGDLRVYRRQGEMLGLEAARVAVSLDTQPLHENFTGVMPSGAPIALYEDTPTPRDLTLRVLNKVIHLPAKAFRPPEEMEAEAAALRADLARVREHGPESQLRLAMAKATQAGWRADNARLYYGQATIPWRLQGIRIGDAALLCVQGEPFIETSQAIEAASPFPVTFFSGYSNGAFGYIPTDQAMAEGGYEVEASPFGPGASDVVVQESIAMLHQLHQS
jgi:hypothetical protein